jgi:hypothetical protein
MTLFTLVTTFSFELDALFPWNIFCVLANLGQSIFLCPFRPQIWDAYMNHLKTLLGLNGSFHCYYSWFLFIFTLHVPTLWLSRPQFVQCLPVFLVSIYGFVVTTNFGICGTNNALWASTCVIPSSHNRATSLCNYNVVIFILVVVIFI